MYSFIFILTERIIIDFWLSWKNGGKYDIRTNLWNNYERCSEVHQSLYFRIICFRCYFCRGLLYQTHLRNKPLPLPLLLMQDILLQWIIVIVCLIDNKNRWSAEEVTTMSLVLCRTIYLTLLKPIINHRLPHHFRCFRSLLILSWLTGFSRTRTIIVGVQDHQLGVMGCL